MSISGIDDLKNVAKKGVVELEQGLVNEPSRADIELFASLMRDRGADEPTRSGTFLAEAVGGRMGSFEQLTQDAKRGMKEVINVNDPSSISDVSRALSRYSLEMAVTTKAIGKGGQAIEKLTNMQ
ncbi:type III secretion apparatus protein, YscI/HrpB, C-terminal domain-containing protein [Pseudomonas flavescens]|uniref:Type III secretion apparatus protein, YscI/HrpB, C-terminal domain-containing protein n=1 Tax=Phytopseudomonas flavescens TaxID=29435 RepID=A0A1G8DLL4_9GAMM|nr:type III secretion system inner rod subunit SctI [Pseudomonas flavescens]SDH58593.1 type III secretion apparatus protein, YscI/HrpB, C-terminal domain-containing protein [Pseudomonas flavescens]